MSSHSQSIFSPRYFALSIGIILSVMAVGFEGSSVTTIAPSIAGDRITPVTEQIRTGLQFLGLKNK